MNWLEGRIEIQAMVHGSELISTVDGFEIIGSDIILSVECVRSDTDLPTNKIKTLLF